MAGERAGTVVLEKHVGASGQLQDEGAPFGLGDVDRQAAFAGVLGHEPGTHAGHDLLPGTHPRADKIAGERFDLDHVGAEQAELVRAVRPGENMGEINDADAVEWTGGHGEVLSVGVCRFGPAGPSSLKSCGNAGRAGDTRMRFSVVRFL